MMLNRTDKNIHSSLVPHLRETGFAIRYDVSCRFFTKALSAHQKPMAGAGVDWGPRAHGGDRLSNAPRPFH